MKDDKRAGWEPEGKQKKRDGETEDEDYGEKGQREEGEGMKDDKRVEWEPEDKQKKGDGQPEDKANLGERVQ